MDGWVKLYRSIDQWEWRSDPNTFSVWMYCLTHARHEAGSWRGVSLEAGQLVTGRVAISKATGVSEKSVRTALQHLQKSGNLSIKSANKYSVITVMKWGFWQGEGGITGQQQASNRPATGQQQATNKNVKKGIKKEAPVPPTPYEGEAPDGGAGAADNIYRYAMKCMKNVKKDDVARWCSVLQPMIVLHAVDEACAHGQNFWGYAEGILKRYEREGIETLAEAKKSDGNPR